MVIFDQTQDVSRTLKSTYLSWGLDKATRLTQPWSRNSSESSHVVESKTVTTEDATASLNQKNRCRDGSSSVWRQLLNLQQQQQHQQRQRRQHVQRLVRRHQQLLQQSSRGLQQKNEEQRRRRLVRRLGGPRQLWPSRGPVQVSSHLPGHRLHHAGRLPPAQVRHQPEGLQEGDARSGKGLQ